MSLDAATLAPAQPQHVPQHMEALTRANRVRLARADLKRSVANGRLDAAEVILTCPWMTETMSLGELLSSQCRWGRTRTHKVLKSLGLTEAKLVSALTERQRVTLAALLEAKRRSRGTTEGRKAGMADSRSPFFTETAPKTPDPLLALDSLVVGSS